MGKNNLHIKVKESGNQTFDKKDYVLTLPEAQGFVVTIEEFEQERNAIQKEFDELVEENRKGHEWIKKDYLKKGKDGWTDQERKSYDANAKVRNETQEKILEKQRNLTKPIKEKYDKVVWKWQLYKDLSKKIGNSPSEKLGHGLKNGVKKIVFPKVLEGGGYIWLEPFFEGDTPAGRPRNGCYIRALGTPAIKKVAWTSDVEGKNSIKKAKLKQTVFLHIETEGLYGQDIDIYLYDEDLGTPDDKLPASDAKRQFQREVNAYRKNNDSGTTVGDTTHIQKVILKLIIDASWKQLEDIDIYSRIVYKDGGIDKVFSGTQLEIEGEKDIKNVASNIAVVKGKIDTSVAEHNHCRYEKITVEFEEDDKPKTLTLFDSEAATQATELLYPVVAGNDQKRKKFTINVIGVKTDECSITPTHKDRVIDISEIKDRIKSIHGKRTDQWRAAQTSYYLDKGEVKSEKSGDMNDDREIDDSHITRELRLVNGISNIKIQKSFKILEKNRPFKFQEPTDGKLEMEVGFDYSFGGRMHPLLGLFKTFVPNNNAIAQKYPIKIKSCARVKPLEIAVIPDSKWTVQLGFNYDQKKFNAVREAYHQKWKTRALEDKETLDKLKAKRINLQQNYMEDSIELDELKIKRDNLKADLNRAKDNDEKKKIIKKIKKNEKELSKKIKKDEKKLGKKWNKGVKKQNKKIEETEAKLRKAKSKTSAKGQLSKAADLMEPDDALEHNLIDCQFSMIAEFDRPYGALELSSKYPEITDFIKKIASIKSLVDKVIKGENKKSQKSFPTGISDRKNKLKTVLKEKKSNWSFEFIPPSIGLSVSWHAERPKDLDKPVIGTMFSGVIDMNPLFGFEVKYDVYHLLYKIKHPAVLAVVATLDLLDDVLGNNFNINLDLIATTTFSGTLMGMANTAEGSKYANRLKEDEDDSPAKFKGALNVSLVGEVNAQGTVDPLFFSKKTIYGAVELKASTGISMEFVTKADNNGIFVEPEIMFEGLILTAGVSAGMVENDSRFLRNNDNKTIEELKNETGLHYAEEGKIIVFDKYEWEKTNWRMPIYSFN